MDIFIYSYDKVSQKSIISLFECTLKGALHESLRAKVFIMKIYLISCNNNSLVYYYLL